MGAGSSTVGVVEVGVVVGRSTATGSVAGSLGASGFFGSGVTVGVVAVEQLDDAGVLDLHEGAGFVEQRLVAAGQGVRLEGFHDDLAPEVAVRAEEGDAEAARAQDALGGVPLQGEGGVP